MRIFGSDRISGLMQRLGMEEGVPVEHNMVTKAIERAQKQVEAQNFSVRKHLLEYDDVMNLQREELYKLRRELLEGVIRIDDEETVDSRGFLMAVAEEELDASVDNYISRESDVEQWNLEGFKRTMSGLFALEPDDIDRLDLDSKNTHEIKDVVWSAAVAKYAEK